MEKASPFVVGAKVGVLDDEAPGGIREDEVAKVFGSGRFALAGVPRRQWRSVRGARLPLGCERFKHWDWEGWATGFRQPSRCIPWGARPLQPSPAQPLNRQPQSRVPE